MSLPEVSYNIGQEFLLTLHLPPDLQKRYESETMIVEAVYRGVWSNEDIQIKDVRILAMTKESAGHHVVEFAGQLWVNDLCGYHGKVKEWQETAVNIEEELAIRQKEEPKEEEILPPGPRPSVRFLSYDHNAWNIDGLKAARIQGDGPIEVCAVTGDELYYVQGDGKQINLRTHAVCTECQRLIGERAIHNGTGRSSWPVIYVGVYCTDCWPTIKESDSYDYEY